MGRDSHQDGKTESPGDAGEPERDGRRRPTFQNPSIPGQAVRPAGENPEETIRSEDMTPAANDTDGAALHDQVKLQLIVPMGWAVQGHTERKFHDAVVSGRQLKGDFHLSYFVINRKK